MRSATRYFLYLVVALFVLAGCSPGFIPDGQLQSPEPTPTPEPTETEGEGPTEEPEPEPTPEPVDPLPDGPVNILLLGTDDRGDTLTGNPDTIILVHLPADRENTYLISFTRDSWVAIPGIGQGKLNSAYPRGGLSTMHATLDQLLGGLDIDFTVQTNMNSFISLTRWLGHFEVENQYATSVTVQSTGRHVEFPQGRIRLENTDGLIYVRQRQGMPLGDLDRTERGRAALVGMLERVQERLQEEPEAFPELIEMLYNNVKVTGDFGLEETLALGYVLQDFDPGSVVSLMAPITGFGMIQSQSVNLVNEPQTAALGTAIRADTMHEYVETYGTDYRP